MNQKTNKKNWKDQFCIDCHFRVDWDCRLNPPSILANNDWIDGISFFPHVARKSDIVSSGISWSSACSHWKEVKNANKND